MSVPQQLRYSREHEWVTADEPVRIGITEYAAEQLGDVVYVSLPDVGADVEAGQPCGEVESTKSVSDVYSPVTGEVVEVNEAVVDEPGLVNSDPYGEGWLFEVRTSNAPEDLLTAEEYTKLTEEG